VDRLACLRGISTLTAFALAVEIGDWSRLSAATIGAYLGLVPGEDSTGEKRAQHGVTKTGNSHVRRLLIEAAWHHRPPYRPSTKLPHPAPRKAGPHMRTGVGPPAVVGVVVGGASPTVSSCG
jgi:hypothetical protein